MRPAGPCVPQSTHIHWQHGYLKIGHILTPQIKEASQQHTIQSWNLQTLILFADNCKIDKLEIFAIDLVSLKSDKKYTLFQPSLSRYWTWTIPFSDAMSKSQIPNIESTHHCKGKGQVFQLSGFSLKSSNSIPIYTLSLLIFKFVLGSSGCFDQWLLSVCPPSTLLLFSPQYSIYLLCIYSSHQLCHE